MQPAEIIAERFVIEELAGRGGMGSVLRARDLASGERVAVKLLDAPGETRAALAAARAAAEDLAQLGAIEECESLVRLAHAEAALAAGQHDEARRAATEGRDRLVRRAEAITEAHWRASFLAGVPENAQLVALAARLGDAER